MSNSVAPIADVDTQDDTPAVPDQFRIHDEPTANWLVRRVVQARAYRQHIKDWAERELRRADREEESFLSRYGPELEAWLNAHLRDTRSRRRSVSLPAGVVGFRRQPAKLVIQDEQAVLTWAKSGCPDAVETVTKTKLRRTALAQHLTRTGELPPTGAEVQPEHDRLTIRPPRK